MIPIKYKKRQFEAHKDIWMEAFHQAVPNTDLGRGRTTSSMIPNLGHSLIKEYLLERYNRKHCVFTNCATDALHFTVEALEDYKDWHVPSYTWCSAVNALYNNKKNIHFLDVHYDTRMLNYDGYDPKNAIMITHVDGKAAPPPPQGAAFIIEDAAQSPLDPNNNYGDALILSFGSSKRLGLLGQGGCVLTDHDWLAERLEQITTFGFDKERTMVSPGQKSFFDPFNALCTLNIYKIYENTDALERIDKTIAYYNDCLGVNRPAGSERYTIKLRDRQEWRALMEKAGIETRVWFKQHANQWDCFSDRRVELPTSDRLTEVCADIPVNEYLSEGEVELIGATLRKHVDLLAEEQ